jgi:small subunit ribosomal protein S8
MSQDVVADGLNQIMNGKRMEKREVEISRFSKLLIELFKIMKKEKYIDFKIDEKENKIIVKILKLNKCQAIKPRYYVKKEDIEKYLRRFLPSRNFGFLIVSTNKGLKNQHEAFENKLGGSLIAYFY